MNIQLSNREAENSIAQEIEERLCTLRGMCGYVGWNDVAHYLALAQLELKGHMSKNEAEELQRTVRDDEDTNMSFLMSNVVPLRRK